MKRIFIFLLLAANYVLHAQTVSSTAPTEISSDSALFDNNTRQLVYLGNVLVSDPRIHLRCEKLTVDLPPQGRPTNVVAETNVKIDFLDDKGQTNHVSSDKAVYAFSVANSVTNETITFTRSLENPSTVETPDAFISSEPLIWDRAANKYHFAHEKIILKGNLVSGTNAMQMNFLK